MNVLIIGLGSIGKRHFQNIITHKKEWGIDMVFVHDTNPVSWDGLEGIGVKGEREFISNLRNLPPTSYDTAIICTPPQFHYPFAVQTRGAHVLIEKPLTYNLPWKGEYGFKIAKIGKEDEDRLVLAAMNLRFHKGVSWARRQVKDGVVGTVLLGKAWYGYNGILKNRPDSPDAQLGPLVSAIHDIDALMWVLRGYVGEDDNKKRLATRLWPTVDKENWGLDYGFARYNLESAGSDGYSPPNIIIRLEADFLAHVRRRGMHIIGEDGEVLIEATGVGQEHIVNIVNEELKWEGQNDINDMYVEELDSFFALCRGDIKREESRLPDVLEVLKLAKALGVKQEV